MLGRTIITMGAVAASLLVAGCSSSGTSQAAPATQAVQCSQCKVKYVRATTGVRPDITRTSPPTKVMECPECRTAVENFFATGKLQHSCNICGGSMEMCEGH